MRKNSRTTHNEIERGAPAPNIERLEEGRHLDDQLRLMCMCCHPALSERSQVLLTLKLVAGLGAEEIAIGLVMKPKTVLQTLTRSKLKIKQAGIPFEIADESHLAERLVLIRQILYLVFNEGYHSNASQSLQRLDLCTEAIRLGYLLVSLHPDDAESAGLLCLMLYQHARSPSRSTPTGEPVLLSDQDRSLWDHALIAEANVVFRRVATLAQHTDAGSYALQAAIAREHARSLSFEKSDWPKICRLYSELYMVKPDPVVLLAWLGAESYRTSPETALALMDQHGLATHLVEYRWFYSTRGELRHRANDLEGALRDFEHALSLAKNPGERRYLERKINTLSS